MRLFPFLVLMRPANIVTAVSDILAGTAIAGFLIQASTTMDWLNIVFLISATKGLYGGGIVLNDVFDLELDKVERPERPIPSGQVTQKQALTLALSLYAIGIIFAFLCSPTSGIIAIGIAACASLYDKYGKHHRLLGPLNMGTCRGLNFLLGMSILPFYMISDVFFISFIPVIFVAAITLTSQGEVLGNNKLSVIFALVLDGIIAGILLSLGWFGVMNYFGGMMKFWVALPFITLWIAMNFSAKLKAITHNEPKNIMKAVKMGVISLIPLNASYVAGFSNWMFGLAVLLLLPISIWLAKRFAVT
jgi:hypothetical protein